MHSLDVQKVLLDIVGHLCKGKFLNQYLMLMSIDLLSF